MKKDLKRKSSEVTTPSQSERAREFFKGADTRYSPDNLLEEFANMMDAGVKRSKKLYDLCDKATYALGLDNHVPAAESLPNQYRYLFTEFIQRIEEEYDCKTGIEKSLAETIALSHIRIITITQTVAGYTTGKVSVNKDINDYYSIVSKELDRAHRQMANAILMVPF